MRAFTSSLVFVFLTVPMMVQAEGIIPCDGPDCSACHVVQLGNNLIVFLVQFLSIVAVIMIVIAGFRMVMSGGNEEAWSSAKKSFTNIIIGILLVLSAWLIVDTVMKMLAPSLTEAPHGQGYTGQPGEAPKFGPWNELECPVSSSGE